MEKFFKFARSRHAIYTARQEGAERPWTTDPVLQKYRFTNVFRELDATTVWFAEKVRNPLRNKPEVLLATVLFRWFNRMTTGEAIFQQLGDYGAEGRIGTVFEYYARTGDIDPMRRAITRFCEPGPYVTGAYIIKTPNGMNKLDGVLWCVEQFATLEKTPDVGVYSGLSPFGWKWASETSIVGPGHVSLECIWDWLRKFPYLGDFMAYEIVTDLRHTALLDKAPDIYTWANPGPGAMRGLNRLHGRDLNKRLHKHVYVCEMRELLRMAEEEMSHIWPKNPSGLPVEMRDIEHTLCEFDKYTRVITGEGRPRGVYR